MAKHPFIRRFFLQSPLHSPTAAAISGFVSGLIIGFICGYIELLPLAAVAGALLGLIVYELQGSGAPTRG